MNQQEIIHELGNSARNPDVVSLLEAQHEQIKKMFGNVLSAEGLDRDELQRMRGDLVSVQNSTLCQA